MRKKAKMVCRVSRYWNAVTLSFSYTAMFHFKESSEQMADIGDPAQIFIPKLTSQYLHILAIF